MLRTGPRAYLKTCIYQTCTYWPVSTVYHFTLPPSYHLLIITWNTYHSIRLTSCWVLVDIAHIRTNILHKGRRHEYRYSHHMHWCIDSGSGWEKTPLKLNPFTMYYLYAVYFSTVLCTGLQWCVRVAISISVQSTSVTVSNKRIATLWEVHIHQYDIMVRSYYNYYRRIFLRQNLCYVLHAHIVW